MEKEQDSKIEQKEEQPKEVSSSDYFAKNCTCGAYVWKDGKYYHVSDCCCQVAPEIEKS